MTISWNKVTELPAQLLPNAFYYLKLDNGHFKEYLTDQNGNLFESASGLQEIENHIADHNNPHVVTKEQIGLDNVNNTADVDKPVSTAQAQADAAVASAAASALASHAGASDPHSQYANSSRFASWLASAVGVSVQAYSATLAALASLTTTAFGRSLLTLADGIALREQIPVATARLLGRTTAGSGSPEEISVGAGLDLASGVLALKGNATFDANKLHYWDATNLKWVASGMYYNPVTGSFGIHNINPQDIFHIGYGGARIDLRPWAGENIAVKHLMSRGSTAAPAPLVAGDEVTLTQIYTQGTIGASPSMKTKFKASTVYGYIADGVYSVELANSAGYLSSAFAVKSSNGFTGFRNSDPICPVDASGPIRSRGYATLALLNAVQPASLGDDMRSSIADSALSHTAGIGTVAVGGGTNFVPVISRGGNWIIG